MRRFSIFSAALAGLVMQAPENITWTIASSQAKLEKGWTLSRFSLANSAQSSPLPAKTFFFECPLSLKLINYGVSSCAQIRETSIFPSHIPGAVCLRSDVMPIRSVVRPTHQDNQLPCLQCSEVHTLLRPCVCFSV